MKKKICTLSWVASKTTFFGVLSAKMNHKRERWSQFSLITPRRKTQKTPSLILIGGILRKLFFYQPTRAEASSTFRGLKYAKNSSFPISFRFPFISMPNIRLRPNDRSIDRRPQPPLPLSEVFWGPNYVGPKWKHVLTEFASSSPE